MVAEWKAAVTQFTELTPHLHYCTSSWRRASHRAILHGKPWRIVVILTIETCYQPIKHEEAGGLTFWGTSIFHQVILNQAHRLRTSGTPIGKFRKANGTLVTMNSRNYNMHISFCILCLELQYKWILTATPLVNGIEDLRWILQFLESSSWMTLQLQPATFDNTLNIDDDWIADGSNVPDTERGARFTQVADPYKKGPEFESPVHYTTMAWDGYMLPIIGEVEKLGKATQTADILIRRHHYEETIEKRAFAVSCTLMLQRTMVRHMPFKNPKPIIDIPPSHVTTELVTFTKSSGAGQFYINLVDGSYKGLREKITGVASAHAATMGKTKPFGPCWRLTCLISIALILGPGLMDPEISSSKRLWSLPSGVAETGRPNLIMLRTVISEFAKAFPGKTDRVPPPEKVKSMTHNQIVAALQFGAPKLAWLKHYLRNTLTEKDNGEKVILWVYWQLTQWLIEQVSTPSQSHFLPLISTLTFNSDIHQPWRLTLTLTLRMTTLTVRSTAAS